MLDMAQSQGIQNISDEGRQSPRPKDRPPTSLKAGQVRWLQEHGQQSHPTLHHQWCHLYHHEAQESGRAHPVVRSKGRIGKVGKEISVIVFGILKEGLVNATQEPTLATFLEARPSVVKEAGGPRCFGSKALR